MILIIIILIVFIFLIILYDGSNNTRLNKFDKIDFDDGYSIDSID